ncbi:ABC transporter substrate-binding protein [Bradyrhizobium sp. LTSPM299]|uniref:ABC transporter substrate-binding protein n=1 Tax=Bradyrhizobium sp. LTSPM299 TaxID=1619233 RepID=UPI0005CB017A|nr:ABC transporter substrate-binding protein [Bradyrhizobium sp. LTSPM299]KJC60393.1 ABC transporter substrate-binding protein [Bradyrhizobium sp. LTSPM299]
MTVRTSLAAFFWAAMVLASRAEESTKIGFITTLSGPAGYLGADARDGFNLAVEMESGKLGGVPVQVVVEDDGFKPGAGKQIADKFLKSEKIKLFTGIIFSNIAGATVPDILDAGGIYVSPNAAPSNFAGKDCNKNYFVVPWQNDALHESAGQNATNLGYKKAFILAPNYQAGKDALTGFKRFFDGEIVGELYTRLDQTDFAPEMAQIRDAKPDVVFQFEPGGLGIAFIRQYQQAGLLNKIPMVLSEPGVDAVSLKALGESALGINLSFHWNSDFDNPANKKFTEAWAKKYGPDRVPTYFASQGYDTALAIGAALKGVNGDISNTDLFRAAMLKADFESVRGAFKFGSNQHPIQDWYAGRVERDTTGKPIIKTLGKIMSNHGDAYSKDCML